MRKASSLVLLVILASCGYSLKDLSKYIDWATHQPVCNDVNKECGCFVWDGTAYKLHECPVTTTTTTTQPAEEPPVVNPPVNQCPAKLPELKDVPGGKSLYINAKPYGQGLDSTPRVRDWDYCTKLAGGVPTYDCKANPEGSGLDSCDKEFLSQNCPTWMWAFAGASSKVWTSCDPRPKQFASCDHFDHWVEWTKVDGVEVENPYLGKCDKDFNNHPYTGFFTVPHTDKGTPVVFKACNKDLTVCSQEIPFESQ